MHNILKELCRRAGGGEEGCVRVCYLLWHIWLRSKQVHLAQQSMTPLKVVQSAVRQAMEVLEAHEQCVHKISVPQPAVYPHEWRPPRRGIVKINCVGA